jgi:hypothetical protein
VRQSTRVVVTQGGGGGWGGGSNTTHLVNPYPAMVGMRYEAPPNPPAQVVLAPSLPAPPPPPAAPFSPFPHFPQARRRAAPGFLDHLLDTRGFRSIPGSTTDSSSGSEPESAGRRLHGSRHASSHDTDASETQLSHHTSGHNSDTSYMARFKSRVDALSMPQAPKANSPSDDEREQQLLRLSLPTPPRDRPQENSQTDLTPPHVVHAPPDGPVAHVEQAPLPQPPAQSANLSRKSKAAMVAQGKARLHDFQEKRRAKTKHLPHPSAVAHPAGPPPAQVVSAPVPQAARPPTYTVDPTFPSYSVNSEFYAPPYREHESSYPLPAMRNLHLTRESAGTRPRDVGSGSDAPAKSRQQTAAGSFDKEAEAAKAAARRAMRASLEGIQVVTRQPPRKKGGATSSIPSHSKQQTNRSSKAPATSSDEGPRYVPSPKPKRSVWQDYTFVPSPPAPLRLTAGPAGPPAAQVTPYAYQGTYVAPARALHPPASRRSSARQSDPDYNKGFKGTDQSGNYRSRQ